MVEPTWALSLALLAPSLPGASIEPTCADEGSSLYERVVRASDGATVEVVAELTGQVEGLARRAGCVESLRALAALRSRSGQYKVAAQVLEGVIAAGGGSDVGVRVDLAEARLGSWRSSGNGLELLRALDVGGVAHSSPRTAALLTSTLMELGVSGSLEQPQAVGALESFRHPERAAAANGSWLRTLLSEALAAALMVPDDRGLNTLDTIGEVLAKRTGDETIRVLARLVRQSPSGSRQELAGLLEAAARRECQSVLEQWETLSVVGVLRDWAALSVAVCHFYEGDLARTLELGRGALVRLESHQPRLVALEAKAHWISGVASHSLGGIDEALDHFNSAAAGAAMVGATNDLGHLAFLRGELEARLDHRGAAIVLLREALLAAQATGARDTWHAASSELGRLAERWGQPAAARAIREQVLAHARSWGDPSALAEAAAASLRLHPGAVDDAQGLAEARAQLDDALQRLPAGSRSERLRLEADLSLAKSLLATDPRSAARRAAEVVRRLSASDHLYLAVEALTVAADCWMAAGDHGQALSALDHARSRVEKLVGGTTDPRLQAGVLAALEPEVRRLLDLEIDAARPAGILAAAKLLTGRYSAELPFNAAGLMVVTGHRRAATLHLHEGGVRAWHEIGAGATIVDRARAIDALIEAGSTVELGSQVAQFRLDTLSTTVAALGPETVLVPDRLLLGAPWSWLGGSMGVGLVVGASASALGRTSLNLPSTVEVLGDGTAGESLESLPATAREAEGVRSLWESRPTPEGRGLGVIHVAAHADTGEALVRRRLTSALPPSTLVWLGICSGLDLREAGFSGLAAELLDRDLAAVVAAPGPVDDESALEAALGFHRRLAAGVPPASALAGALTDLLDRRPLDVRAARFNLYIR